MNMRNSRNKMKKNEDLDRKTKAYRLLIIIKQCSYAF